MSNETETLEPGLQNEKHFLQKESFCAFARRTLFFLTIAKASCAYLLARPGFFAKTFPASPSSSAILSSEIFFTRFFSLGRMSGFLRKRFNNGGGNCCGGFLGFAEFISEYYINPIISHEGYNIVNTATYALIAVAAVWLAFRVFEKCGIKTSREFVLCTLPFVLFGSTVRVVTDSIDTGVMKPVTPLHQWIMDSHVYDYGFLTSSPGIYVVTAVLFFASLAAAGAAKKPAFAAYMGLALWIPHFLVLLPMMGYGWYALPVLLLAALPFVLALRHFRDWLPAGIVGAHALDGAATFFIIDFFGKMTGRSYFEQHVIPGFIGETFGTFFPFYLLKIAIAYGAAWFIVSDREAGENEKNYVSLLLIIIGLAPGLRDLLRMAVGA